MKNTIETVPTFYLLAIRFLGAFAILALMCVKKWKTIDRKTALRGLVMGVLLILAYTFQTIGLHYTTPGKNAFLTAVYCVVTPFLGWIFAKQRADKYNVAAAMICIAGIGLVSLNESLRFGLGDLLSVLSGVMLAGHMVCTSMFTKDGDVLLLTCVQFFFAGLLSLIAAAGFETFPDRIPQDAVLSLVYLCVFSTAAALLLQSFGQKYTSASSASLLLSLEAVFGVVFSVALYGEALSGRLIAGFALIFTAIIMSETKFSFLRLGKKSDVKT